MLITTQRFCTLRMRNGLMRNPTECIPYTECIHTKIPKLQM